MSGDPGVRTTDGEPSTAAPKVVHLTSAHSSRDTRIFRKECRSLAAAGFDVVLVAQNAVREEVREGVLVRGLETPSNRWMRMTRTTRRLLHLALEEDADLYQFHDPELLPVGLLLKTAGHNVVWDVHEDLPKQVLQKQWIAPPFKKLVSWITALGERFLVRAFDAVVAATPTIGDRYRGRRTIILNNYPRLADLNCDSSTAAVETANTVVYTGSITRVRGIFQIVEAVRRVADESEVRLRMAGKFSPPDLQDRVASTPGWSLVDYHGWLAPDDLYTLLRQSMAGLLLFQPAPNHLQSQPNKMFEYMAAGLPIIASDFPMWRRLIEEEVGCGLVVDPTSPTKIADAIRWICNHKPEAVEMGRRGREAVRTRFNWESEEEKLLELYDDILSGT